MRRIIIGLVALIVVVAVVAGAGWAYLTLTSGSGEASEAISAPELASSTGAATTVYRIVPEQSEVRFIIDEELRGVPTTVVGTTNQVTGDIALDASHPASSEVGTIRVNVRTLQTPEDGRNRALRSFILKSAEDANEFAEFKPTAVEGLPQSLTPGEPISFKITGDLTVSGVTQPVTFDATAILADGQEQISGQASTTVQYQDFNLTIPNVPFVANVADDVRLEIDFVAQPVAA